MQTVQNTAQQPFFQKMNDDGGGYFNNPGQGYGSSGPSGMTQQQAYNQAQQINSGPSAMGGTPFQNPDGSWGVAQ